MLFAFVRGTGLREVQSKKVFEETCAEAALQAQDQSNCLFECGGQIVRGVHIAVKLLGDAFLFAPFEFQQHMFLGWEMKEESAVCDSGGRNDRADVGVCHATAFELGDSSAQQALPGLQALGLAR